MKCDPKFEWDPAKDRVNRAKHGLSFAEASELFSSDVEYLEIYDLAHSVEEDRFVAVGPIRGILARQAWLRTFVN